MEEGEDTMASAQLMEVSRLMVDTHSKPIGALGEAACTAKGATARDVDVIRRHGVGRGLPGVCAARDEACVQRVSGVGARVVQVVRRESSWCS